MIRHVVLILILLFLSVDVAFCRTLSRKNDVLREHYDNGKLKIEVVYKKDFVVRKRFYFRNGEMQLEEQYHKGNIILKRTFFESGQLKSIWTKKTGATKYYNPDGTVKIVVDLDPEDLNKVHRSSYIFSDP